MIYWFIYTNSLWLYVLFLLYMHNLTLFFKKYIKILFNSTLNTPKRHLLVRSKNYKNQTILNRK
jgi:hypothetical protein